MGGRRRFVPEVAARAAAIRTGTADTNSRILHAAAGTGISVPGTGGHSIAKAQQMGVNVVPASGTTFTTSTTCGVMVGSIPASIALALVPALSRIPVPAGRTEVFDTLIAGLPIGVAAVAARKTSGLDEVGLVAGALAGILSARGGILDGLVGGILAGLLAAYLISWMLSRSFPAIIGGVRHSVILPLVLLEMGQKGTSFFGATDMVAPTVTAALAFALTLLDDVPHLRAESRAGVPVG